MSSEAQPAGSPRETLILVALAVISIVFFIVVLFLSKSYRRHEDALGRRLYGMGASATQLGQFDSAVNYYQAALNYSRGNYLYELALAQSLVALDRRDQARTYLVSLWEQRPEDGTVNLELARLFAKQGAIDPTLRYYHNAIYALWHDDPEAHREQAREELVRFLLNHQATAQAESEIIAMAAGEPENQDLHRRAGDLFMQVQDYQNALKQYEAVWRLNRKDALAAAGAGHAAFKLGLYRTAERHLQSAVDLNPADAGLASELKTAKLVLQLDPYARGISEAERSRRVLEAFRQAGERAEACVPPSPDRTAPTTPASGSSLYSEWAQMKARVTMSALRQDSDFRDKVLGVAFAIEQQTSTNCVAPDNKDQALLLIGLERERTER